MPKRSADKKIERYRNKIERLLVGNKRRRVRVIESDSSEENEGAQVESRVVTAQVHNAPVDGPELAPASPSPPLPLELPEIVPPSSPEVDVLPEIPAPEEPSAELGTDGANIEFVLDPELLEALGESTSDTPDFGDKIHENLANLWLPLLKKGTSREKREKLHKEYLVPDNCRLLQAPKLNAEISAAVPDTVRNRDKSLMAQQQQLGFGITATNRALDLLLKGDDKKLAIQHLSNSCRILADLHSAFTQNRIKLVSPSLDKSFLHVIQDAERDETLFGIKLSEKIKAAKAIEKQGLQIKKVNNPKVFTSSHPTNSGYNRTTNSGNWSAPPRYQSQRGSRGGAKKFTPARRPNPSSTHHQATKSSTASKSRAPTTQ